MDVDGLGLRTNDVPENNKRILQSFRKRYKKRPSDHRPKEKGYEIPNKVNIAEINFEKKTVFAFCGRYIKSTKKKFHTIIKKGRRKEQILFHLKSDKVCSPSRNKSLKKH